MRDHRSIFIPGNRSKTDLFTSKNCEACGLVKLNVIDGKCMNCRTEWITAILKNKKRKCKECGIQDSEENSVNSILLLCFSCLGKKISPMAPKPVQEEEVADSVAVITIPGQTKPKTKTLKKELVQAFLKSTPKNKFFAVTFVKLDGSIRELNARRDVRKHLKGGESTIKHKKNLVSVYDMIEKGYRCFDVTRVVSLRAGHAELKVVDTGD